MKSLSTRLTRYHLSTMLLMSLAAVDSSLYRLAHSVCHSWKASSCRCNQLLQMQDGATDQHGQHCNLQAPNM